MLALWGLWKNGIKDARQVDMVFKELEVGVLFVTVFMVFKLYNLAWDTHLEGFRVVKFKFNGE